MADKTMIRTTSLVDVRLNCLDLAARSAVLSGRANLTEVADQYFEWVMKPVPAMTARLLDLSGARFEQEPRSRQADDGPIGEQPTPTPAATPAAPTPVAPSLRQAGAKKD